MQIRIQNLPFMKYTKNLSSNEKNLIKALIDDYNLDHLMFSLRPSALNFLKQIPDFNFIEFKDITQVIFVLQSMARYNIPLGIVSNRNLTLFNKIDEIEALELLEYLENYLLNFEAIVNKYNFFNLNIKKLFCSIFSLTNVKNNLNGGKINFIEKLIETIFIEIIQPNGKKIIIGNI